MAKSQIKQGKNNKAKLTAKEKKAKKKAKAAGQTVVTIPKG